VTPLNMACTSGCLIDIPDNTGNFASSHWWTKTNRGAATPFEAQLDELLQVQSNQQNSSVSKVVSLPTTQTYKIAVDVQGRQSTPPGGGSLVWPVMQVSVNGAVLNFCKYPNNNTITTSSSLTVDQRGHTGPDGSLHEYAETCATSLFAGNNTVAVSIIGGPAHGGQLQVRHVVLYAVTGGVQGRVACYVNRVYVDGGLKSGTDLFDLNTQAKTWAATACVQNPPIPYYVNLTGDSIGATGCANGAQPCKMLELF